MIADDCRRHQSQEGTKALSSSSEGNVVMRSKSAPCIECGRRHPCHDADLQDPSSPTFWNSIPGKESILHCAKINLSRPRHLQSQMPGKALEKSNLPYLSAAWSPVCLDGSTLSRYLELPLWMVLPHHGNICTSHVDVRGCRALLACTVVCLLPGGRSMVTGFVWRREEVGTKLRERRSVLRYHQVPELSLVRACLWASPIK